jgi:uncharacterized protein (DUF1330 family)
MPKAYWVTTYREIKDPAKLAAYAKLAPLALALAPFGVRYLCRGNPNATYESGLKERLVVSEFPSLDKAIAGHDSPGYQEALRALATAPCGISGSLRGWSKQHLSVHFRVSGNPSGSPLSAGTNGLDNCVRLSHQLVEFFDRNRGRGGECNAG